MEVYWLSQGKFVLNSVYTIYPDYDLRRMTNEEKAEITYKFKTSLFDDLTIDLEEVFEDVWERERNE